MKVGVIKGPKLIRLAVTEDLRWDDLPSLKVGLSRLIEMQANVDEKLTIFLDLTAVSDKIHFPGPDSEKIREDIVNFQLAATKSGVLLVIVDKQPAFGDISVFQKTEQLMDPQMSRLLLLQIQLKGQYRLLRNQKSKLESLFTQSKSKIDIKALRKENSDLKARVSLLENLVLQKFKQRAKSVRSNELKFKFDEAFRVLTTIMQREEKPQEKPE